MRFSPLEKNSALPCFGPVKKWSSYRSIQEIMVPSKVEAPLPLKMTAPLILGI